MATMYGYDINSIHDRFVLVAEEAMTIGSFFIVPGNAYVNSFPILKYVPAWFPGAEFKRQAAYVKALVSEMQKEPFQYVKNNMVRQINQVFSSPQPL